MNRDETRKAAEEMLAWVNGGTLQVRARRQLCEWSTKIDQECAAWNWSEYEYRIAPPEPREFYISRARDGSKALAFDARGMDQAVPVVTTDPRETEVIRVREILEGE